MAITVEMNIVSNDKTLISIFIDNRPIIWGAHSSVKKDSNGINKRNIIYTSFLNKVVKKYVDNEINTATLSSNLVIQKLKGRFSTTDINVIFQINCLTENIISNMQERKYYNPLKNPILT